MSFPDECPKCGSDNISFYMEYHDGDDVVVAYDCLECGEPFEVREDTEESEEES